MKKKHLKWKHKGKSYEMDLAIPSDLKEAQKTLGEDECYECFVTGYIAKSKRDHAGIKPKRKNFVRLNIGGLSPEQRKALKQLLGEGVKL